MKCGKYPPPLHHQKTNRATPNLSEGTPLKLCPLPAVISVFFCFYVFFYFDIFIYYTLYIYSTFIYTYCYIYIHFFLRFFAPFLDPLELGRAPCPAPTATFLESERTLLNLEHLRQAGLSLHSLGASAKESRPLFGSRPGRASGGGEIFLRDWLWGIGQSQEIERPQTNANPPNDILGEGGPRGGVLLFGRCTLWGENFQTERQPNRLPKCTFYRFSQFCSFFTPYF